MAAFLIESGAKVLFEDLCLLPEHDDDYSAASEFGRVLSKLQIEVEGDRIGRGKGATLRAAVRAGNGEMAKATLESPGWKSSAGTRVRAKAKSTEETALHLAASLNNVEMINLLIKYGGEGALEKTDVKGRTPLHAAFDADSPDAALCLMDKLAHCCSAVNAKDNDGKTILHLAAEKDWNVVAEKAIGAGATVDALDQNQMTPLHLAALSGATYVSRLLLAKGTKSDLIKLQDKKGKTPLHHAVMYCIIPSNKLDTSKMGFLGKF